MMHRVEIVCLIIVIFFFFQAEDGIRDLVRSRGLGDVYKRQPPTMAMSEFMATRPEMSFNAAADITLKPNQPTHLSLIHI